MENIENRLLEEIRESEMSVYEIARKSGVSQASLSLFLNGKRSLTLRSANKLAEALNLELVKKKGR